MARLWNSGLRLSWGYVHTHTLVWTHTCTGIRNTGYLKGSVFPMYLPEIVEKSKSVGQTANQKASKWWFQNYPKVHKAELPC